MSFVHPAFLWGLLAVAIPVIIHLFQFRRYRTLHFSDTRFIEELQTEQKRQSQLKKLIILTLRILAIIAVVLAFAQPYRHRPSDRFHEGSASVIICIDNSFSMENSSDQGSLLNEAKNRAAAIVEAFDESASFMLLTNDLEGRHARFFNATEMKEEISRLQSSPISRPMDQLMAYGFGFLEQEKSGNRQFFLLSDFQQSTVPLATLPNDSSVQIRMVPLKPDKQENIYIDSCWFESPLFLRQQECRLHLRVRNNGSSPVEQLPVKLYLNGQQKAIANTDIAADGRALAEMAFTPDASEWQQGCVEITDHPVTFDDRYYFSFRTRDRHPVLCLYDDKENRFLHALFAEDSAIGYQTMRLQQMDYSRLPQQNLVILNPTNEVGSGCLQELRRYVEEGGCLLVIPSPKADAQASNAINSALGLPAFTLLDTHRSRVAELLMEHRIFARTMQRPTEQVRLPAVFRHFRMAHDLHQGKEVLVSLENGDELLGAYSLGRGCIYLLTVPLEDAFSEFQRHAIFVPALYNMALFQNNPQAPCYRMGGNEPIPMEAEAAHTEKLPELRNAALQFSCIPEIRNSYHSSELFLHDQLREAGNYLLCQQEDTLQALSFNYDRRESELHYWDSKELKKACEGHPNREVLALQHLSSAAMAEKINGKSRRNGLFIWIALALLLTESLLLRLWKE
ncbi:MAG: BatA and WFA domain-containing protein [Bacteroidales bacterium]|nr:BatA and WFA domain-containing protein [Bacteroidales bacterium]